MENNRREEQIEAVADWWNLSRNQKKWDKPYDSFKKHGGAYLKSRQEIALKYVDEVVLGRLVCVLELGYGAGQTALELGRRGHEVYGLDISAKLCESATERCKSEYPEGKFHLKVGSIESKYEFPEEMFDVVVVVGALQYLHSPDECFKEVWRVLKPGGYFIVAQRNIYSLSNLTSLRYFLRSFITFFLREEYELFPSFKSILMDSKMGSYFGRFKDSKFLNTKFMLKGHDVWKFKIKKRANSYNTLKNRLKKHGFTIEKSDGAYYAFSENPSYYDFNIRLDNFIKRFAKHSYFNFLSIFGRSIVFKAMKGNFNR